MYPEIRLPIDDDAVREAHNTLLRYRQAKARLEARVIDNEQWYKLRHWQRFEGSGNPGDPEPASAWLFNCIVNKHADAMDHYPKPYLLPREEGDRAEAETLSAILPAVIEQNEYEQVYSDVWWAKLKGGTGVTGVFWNPRKHNGLGDIDIRKVDILQLYWEPGVDDIQASRNVFHMELWDNDVLVKTWPRLDGRLGGAEPFSRYVADENIDTSRKTAVTDWYYKRAVNGREVVHYVKYAAGMLLYASENDPKYALSGFYDHGRYPFVLDAQFVEEGSPAGFGYIDICKQPQMYIDKLNQVILKHAVMAARPRFFIRGDGAINEAEYADWSKDFVHYQGGANPADSIKQISLNGLDATLVAILNGKIDELKETSGNRDFSQGSTSGGVTAASAIAALQEAGGKLSRDMLKSAYRAFTRICYLCIELIRQFYDEPRCFRILGASGEERFIRYDNAGIRARRQANEFGVDMGQSAPVFDIRVRAEKSSPYTAAAVNELAKEFFRLGFFRPDNAESALACVEMMDFEGKDSLMKRLNQNAAEHERTRALERRMVDMARILDKQNGTQIAPSIMREFAVSPS